MIPTLKKHAKYFGIVGGGVFLILGYIFITSWLKKKRTGDEGLSGGTEDLQSIINEMTDKIVEVQTQADVEIAVARSKETAVKEELREVVQIKDKVRRRRRLAELYKRTR